MSLDGYVVLFRMAENKIEQRQAHHAAEQDDLLWTSKLALNQTQSLTGRSISAPKSRLGGVAAELYERVLKSLGTKGSLEKFSSMEERLKSFVAGQGQVDASRNVRVQATVNLIKDIFSEALGHSERLSPSSARAESRNDKVQAAVEQESARSKRSQQQQQSARMVESAQRTWITFACQLMGANLKRLGFEPSELDDIRLELIRQGAATYAGLKKLDRLPDSLDASVPSADPEALKTSELKAVEDIRTLLIAYVVQAVLEQIVKDLESEEEKKPIPIPKWLTNKFSDIPEIEVDLTKLVQQVQTV